ncbi:MAG TPA: hypothetical protein VLE48_05150 [Terriglobales bacterium]|nr:hypothetical protein [Terriglobales bacterium]
MARMIDLIRESAVPAAVMRTAAKGALSVPPAEMIEILVFLSSHAIFGEQARMTLAGWDEKACLATVSDPATPWQVLEYFIAPQNRRPKLVPALLENPTLRESRVVELAAMPTREAVEMLLASERARKSVDVLHALASNPAVKPEEMERIKQALAALGETAAELAADLGNADSDTEKTQYEVEHAAEIAAEEGKPFELVGGAEAEDEEAPAAAVAAVAATAAANPEGEQRERISTLQKISRLTVGLRVQLAMKGNKDERFILIRDGSKIVSSAVLQSPKLSDAEVETFAAMKNVQESVLRDIARNRKFMKSSVVIKNLVNNPRCPLDLSLTLMNHLNLADLKGLSGNKNVPETLRKLALKQFKLKSAPPGGKKSE